MGDFCESPFAVLLGVALLIFAIVGSVALIFANGQSQTCARAGGHWMSTETPVAPSGQADGSVERSTECKR